MPSILEPYKIATLPLVSKLALESRAHLSSLSENILTVAISRASVAIYTLTPSPQLIWSRGLAPNVTVLGVASTLVDDSEPTDVFSTNVRIALIVEDGKSHKLRFIETGNDEFTAEVPLDKPVGVLFRDGFFYVVETSGTVKKFEFIDGKAQQLWKAPQVIPKVVRAFLADNCLQLVRKDSHNSITLHTVSLAPSGIEPVSSAKLPSAAVPAGIASIDGQRIYLTDAAIVSVEGRNTRSVPYKALDPSYTFSAAKPPSFVTLSKDRVLLCLGSALFLLDIRYAALISRRDVEATEVFLQLAVPASSVGKKNNWIVHALQIHRKEAALVGLSVESGKGTLLETLGKGLETEEENGVLTNGRSIGDLISLSSYLQEMKRTTFERKITQFLERNEKEAEKVLETLQKYKTEGNFNGWNQSLIFYLKSRDVAWTAAEAESKQADSLLPVFEETDREVSYLFLEKVVTILLKGGEFDPSFAPEKLLIYLLTHPLYPSQLFSSLEVYKFNIKLFHQAVITAPGVPAGELIKVIECTIDDKFGDVNDDIFKDATTRLLEQFGKADIKKCLKETQLHQNTNVVLKCVAKIMKADFGWELLNLLIDCGGLFSLDAKVLDRLAGEINSKITTYMELSEVNSIISELVGAVDINTEKAKSKKTKKKSKKKDEQIANGSNGNVSTPHDKLDRILGFSKTTNPLSVVAMNEVDIEMDVDSNKTVTLNEAARPVKSISSKRGPMYSIETLVL